MSVTRRVRGIMTSGARRVEARRARGHVEGMLLATALCALPANALSAQRTVAAGRADADRWVLTGDVLAVGASTWLSSATAPTVRTDVGVGLTVGAQRAFSPRSRGGLAVRVQSQPLTLREAGVRWDGGTLTVSDLVGTLAVQSLRAAGLTSEVEISSGVSVLTGARAVYPFSSAGSITAVVGIGTVAYRTPRVTGVSTRRPLGVVVRFDLVRVDPGASLAARTDTFKGTAGWTPRVSAGLRVHR